MLLAAVGAVAAGSAAAGLIDIARQKREQRQAKAEGQAVHIPYGPYEKYWKRPLDFALSGTALVILSPILLAITALVRVNLGSPVVFSQLRPGRSEKPFHMMKFRSLTNQKDTDGNLLPDEKRLTSFGKRLRSTSLDELLELVCIVKGDMSIVGPRPLLVKYLPLYNERQKHRHDVRPGLTGLAQVSGRNGISWEEKFEYDCAYVDRITFIGDVKIILKTVLAVLRREGISSETSVTMEAFRGTPAPQTVE